MYFLTLEVMGPYNMTMDHNKPLAQTAYGVIFMGQQSRPCWGDMFYGSGGASLMTFQS